MAIRKRVGTILTCLALLLLTDCAKKRPAELPPPPRETVESDTGNAFLVHVAYATDRELAADVGPLQRFGGRRDRLRYGHATVSIPRSHELGELELPRWFKLEFEPDPAKHFTVAASQLLTPDQWSADVKVRVEQSGKKALFLFVHGYNVTFDAALMRTAQIAHDVAFPGPAVLFSWPSKGTVAGYFADDEDARYAIPDLLAVPRRSLATTGAEEVYLIAHSMGNQVLTQALVQLGKTDPAARSKIKEVILAAPDIDAGIFKRDIAPFLAAAGQRYTLYASSKDLALATSARLRTNYVRVGDTSPTVTIAPPIQTIDASSTSADLLGHSYIGASNTVLGDVRRIFMLRASPAQRGLLPVGKSGALWRFPVPAPAR